MRQKLIAAENGHVVEMSLKDLIVEPSAQDNRVLFSATV